MYDPRDHWKYLVPGRQLKRHKERPKREIHIQTFNILQMTIKICFTWETAPAPHPIAEAPAWPAETTKQRRRKMEDDLWPRPSCSFCRILSPMTTLQSHCGAGLWQIGIYRDSTKYIVGPFPGQMNLESPVRKLGRENHWISQLSELLNGDTKIPTKVIIMQKTSHWCCL